ncbi:Enhancer of rudimentary [Intoshia linei]|uniref:Enhancer of rudimentary homolog n=1 Tax=Intoshia linei TaxID=1819745 RepID=A0A177B146_9BILA|nr:Enhancer of rudimentary [Intoshia linei]
MSDKMEHTLLMIQTEALMNNRTYSDFDNVEECIEHICKLYETHLQNLYPNQDSITYDVSQLFEYIDEIPDIFCLTFNKECTNYVPHNKVWLKEIIYRQLKTQAKKL